MGQIYGYVRVSSRDQNEARQMAAMREAGVSDADIYLDKRSGADFERQGYRRLLRKRQTFYLGKDVSGNLYIYPGRLVEARVIAVAEKVLRVEAFGIECAIFARDLSWQWVSDVRDLYSVGDRVLVRVQEISGEDVEHLSIRADIRSTFSETSVDNLKKCQVQSKYAGKVTDLRGGVVYIRLNNGVNAIAHTCYDSRMPGKKDDVSFAVTRLDEEHGIAVGIITRIIKRNL